MSRRATLSVGHCSIRMLTGVRFGKCGRGILKRRVHTNLVEEERKRTKPGRAGGKPPQTGEYTRAAFAMSCSDIFSELFVIALEENFAQVASQLKN
jgi:hypothetical protein